MGGDDCTQRVADVSVDKENALLEVTLKGGFDDAEALGVVIQVLKDALLDKVEIDTGVNDEGLPTIILKKRAIADISEEDVKEVIEELRSKADVLDVAQINQPAAPPTVEQPVTAASAVVL